MKRTCYGVGHLSPYVGTVSHIHMPREPTQYYLVGDTHSKRDTAIQPIES